MRHCSKLLVIAVTLVSLGGCIGIGGRRETTPPTLGRQLMDLKVAFDQNAMTEQEYQQAKSRLILND